MAGRQDAAGCGGAGGGLTPARLAVLVHDRPAAEAALALGGRLGVEVELVTPAGIMGPAAVGALEVLLGRPIWVLCDDRPGLALEALRVGLRRLVLEVEGQPGDPARLATARLADIARQLGGELRRSPPGPLHVVHPDGRRFAPLEPVEVLGSASPLVP